MVFIEITGQLLLGPIQFQIQKRFATKEKLDQKILNHKNFGGKKIFDKKKFVQKKFGSEKNFDPQKLGVQKTFGLKKCWHKKKFRSKIFFDPKEFWFKEIIGPKIFWVLENVEALCTQIHVPTSSHPTIPMTHSGVIKFWE